VVLVCCAELGGRRQEDRRKKIEGISGSRSRSRQAAENREKREERREKRRKQDESGKKDSRRQESGEWRVESGGEAKCTIAPLSVLSRRAGGDKKA